MFVVFPPTGSGPSPGLTAKRVGDAVGAVARAARPSVAVAPLSRSEAAFAGPASAIRALEAAVPRVLRTDRDGTVRAWENEERESGLATERWRDGRWRSVPDK